MPDEPNDKTKVPQPTGEGSGQGNLADAAKPPEKPVTASEQVEPTKSGAVAEGQAADAVKPAPPAVKPVADRPAGPDAKTPSPQSTPPKPAAAAPAAGAPPAKPAAPAKPPGPTPKPWEGELSSELKRQFGSGVEPTCYLSQNYVVADARVARELLQILHRDGYDYLVDVTATHYPAREKPFEVIWILYSFGENLRVRVKANYAEGEKAPSVVELWPTANWLEREVYDMFGIEFEGHPDMRRILLPDGWKGFPLRKDYSILQQDQEWVQINLGIESGQ